MFKHYESQHPLFHLLICVLIFLFTGCTPELIGGLRTRGLNPTVTATHQGWVNVKAVGAKTPVVQATGLSAVGLRITLSWNPFTVTGGPIASYNIYRATASGAQDFNTPLANVAAGASPSYTDTTAVAATTYYYVVRPVVYGVARATSESFSEIKVIAPPPNMSLVHRWIANAEMCGLMGRTPDPLNNYRCAYIGPGGDGTYFDIGASQLVDTYGVGCNYTPGGCGDPVHGCIGTVSPVGAVTGNNGDVYYERNNGVCWYNTSAGSGTSWNGSYDGSATTPQRLVMASNSPGLPPMIEITQNDAYAVCTGTSAPGFPGTKKLPSRKLSVVAAAWDPSMTDAAISAMENGQTLNVTGQCNSNSGDGLVYQDANYPADPETIPGGNTAGPKAVRTGSNATRNCVSRYGLQDMVGNMWGYNSDQLGACNAGTHVCPGITSALDATNTMLNGFNFNGAIGPGSSTINEFDFSTMLFSSTRFNVPLGLPMVTAAPAGFDSLVIGTGAGQFDPAHFHGNRIYLYTDSGGPRRSISSGGYYGNVPNQNGRFSILLSTTDVSFGGSSGFRCSIPAE